MVAEVFAGLSAIKSVGLKDIHDATLLNSALIELQQKILDAQAAQSALVERISELDKVLASFERWDAEKKRYQ
jgi:hypothetical protein